MSWLRAVAALSVLQAVHCLLNSTSIMVNPDGITVYPCHQVHHFEQEFDSSMMGLWYVIEIIHHREPSQTESQDACPTLNLYMNSKDQVKVIWHEKAGDVHYNFKMADPENRGFWIIWGRQNGTKLSKPSDQFSGSVQVLEAKPNWMVLRFCSFNRTHFSIIMVRNNTVPHDTQKTRATLIGYGLEENSVRQTCLADPNSSHLSKSLPALVLLSMLSSMLFRLY